MSNPQDTERDSQFWLKLAEEAVSEARKTRDKEKKAILLRIAANYREIGRICRSPKPN